MPKKVLALAALSLILSLAGISTASAWHLSKRACLRHAFTPHCASGSAPTCTARRSCAIEPHKTVQVCAEWQCRPRP